MMSLILTVWMASPVAAQTTTEKVFYTSSLVGAFTLHIVDIEMTRHVIDTRKGEEANPLYRWAEGKVGLLGVVKGAGAGTTHTLIHYKLWRKGHHKLAIAANLIVAGVTFAVVENNRRYVQVKVGM